MKDTPAARAAARLITLHAELRSLIRTLVERSQRDLFDDIKTGHLSTVDAHTAERTIKVSLPQACTLMRATISPSAHDFTTKIEHATLVVSLHHFLAELGRITTADVPPASIAAGQVLLAHLTTWLKLNNVVVMMRTDSAHEDMRARPRQPYARVAKRRPTVSRTVVLALASAGGPDPFPPAADADAA